MNTPVCTCEKPVLWCPDPPRCMNCEGIIENSQATWEEDLQKTAPWLYRGAKYRIIVRFIREHFIPKEVVREELERLESDPPANSVDYTNGYLEAMDDALQALTTPEGEK